MATDRPTGPLGPEEMKQVLAACDDFGQLGQRGHGDARRVRAMVLLLRHSGLRIGDAVALKRTSITGDKLFLSTAKTGTPIYLPLPGIVIEALAACPCGNDEYFFWNGRSKVESAVSKWQRDLKRVFQLAAVARLPRNRFRETFAIDLLLAGLPIDRVSVLLGYSSVKVTGHHHAPWLRARQEQLEAHVRRSWKKG
jgi:integrase/recombinase XerD